MNDWTEIRRRVLMEGVSWRQILRETGMHRQQQPRLWKKLGAFVERINHILKDNQAMPRKQRHTAKRIWERLLEDGFTGGYTVIKQRWNITHQACLCQTVAGVIAECDRKPKASPIHLKAWCWNPARERRPMYCSLH
jgi:hypothetical protein